MAKKYAKIQWVVLKSYDEDGDKGYILEVYFEYSQPSKTQNLHKCNKKTNIKPWINTKKVHKVIQFNQKAWFKSYIDMNTKLSTEAKDDFEKYFFKLMNKAVFEKNMEKVKNMEILSL